MTHITIERENLEQALSALKRMASFGNTFGYRSSEQNPYEQVCEAIRAIEQDLEAPVQTVAWAEYNYKKGRFTGLTTNDIDAVDSVGDGCQWVPQLQATPPAAPVPLTVEQIHSLWRNHPNRTNIVDVVRAIEAAHGITKKGQP